MTGEPRRARPQDVDPICAALPGAEKGVSWGDRPTWFAGGNARPRSFLIHRAPQQGVGDPATGVPYDDLLVVRVPDASAKAALVEGAGPWFTIAHFDGYDAVLVQQSRLDEIGRDELAEVLAEAWASRAPKRLVREHLGD